MIRTLTLGAAGLIMLAVAGPTATSTGPAATRSLSVQVLASVATSDEPHPEVVNDEVVLAELDATGLPERAILVSRITVEGAEREVIDPASTTNVRYLDRLGRPTTTPDGVVLVVGGDRAMALTEARFDKPLPVALHAEYAVDGDVVAAAAVPGATGDVRVTYTLTNTTAEQVELTYTDASGQEQDSVEPVFVPLQGSLTATLPEDTELIEAPDAMLATDEQGRTVARWNVALFPPISTPIQTLELTMRTERAAVPGAEVLLTPAGTDQDPATGFADELLDGSNSGSEELYEGLSTLDAAAGEIAEGTDELATGLAALAEGATAASGASQTLAQGVGGLADGAEAAADASDTLAQGVGGLAAGADEVAAGSAELAGALGQAATGAQDLASATAALADATAGAPEAQLDPLITGGQQIEVGLLEAAARIGSPSDPVLDLIAPLPPDDDSTCPPGGTAPPDDDCVTIYQGVRALRDGLAAVDAVAAALEGRVDAAREAVVAMLEGLGSISDDVTAAAEGAAELYASVCLPPDPTLDADSCAQLLAVAEAAESALATAGETVPDITDLVAALAILEKQAATLSRALDVALASTERLLLGVEAVGLAVGAGTPSQPGLATAMSALNAGLGELAAELARSQRELVTAASAVAAGSAELATGIDGAATGAETLSEGSELLADGATDAASGADVLAEGSEQLAQGAQDAAQGADQLSSGLSGLATGTDGAAVAGGYLAEGTRALQDGTGPAADGVLDASLSPALAQAWLEAAAERAAEALPYGPPVGAQGNVAYVFSLAEVPAPRSFWERIRGMFGG